MTHDLDVAILGSGAAALTAAITAHDEGCHTAVFEKADLVGGTSAWSGGMVWIPNNHHMREAGKSDSAAEAIEYLLSMSHGMMDEVLIRTFVDTGPQMVRWLEANTPVQFQLVGSFPDYHPEKPGGKPQGGRSLECPLYSFKNLGAWGARVSQGDFYPETLTTMSESPIGQMIPATLTDNELQRRRTNDERGCGQALIGRLLRGCLDRKIAIHTAARATELMMERGVVTGVRIDADARSLEVRAAAGVVLATGGFEWNPQMTTAFLRGPMTGKVSAPTNTGDGLIMSIKAGAQLANMREAWWLPVAEVPREGREPQTILITCERTFPGSIMINRRGRRFTNEAANYNAFGAAFHEMDVSSFEYRNLPCWLLFDQAYYDRYGFGWNNAAGKAAPDWIAREDSLPKLARRLGIPEKELTATIARWNSLVADGRDVDFGRGDSANDTWWGDPNMKGQRAATLGTIARGPYYAVEIKSGCLGTKGGPRVDSTARVLDHAGTAIAGLYAAGNVMGSPMGMTYGGAGGTIAPGMVFGFLAARHAAARLKRQPAKTA